MLPRLGRSSHWSWTCYWLVAVAVAVCVAEAAGQCFVCSPRNRHDADVPSCEHFVSTDEKFIQDCKPFRGCLSEFDGDRVKRSCSEDDTTETCHRANGIRYCYCKEPLCNGVRPPPDDAGDDDAEGDGSGAGGLLAAATPSSRSTPKPSARDAVAMSRGAIHAVPPILLLLLVLGL